MTTSATPDLPEWLIFFLSDTSLLQAVFWLAAIIALIAAVIKLWPAIGRFVVIVNATAGLPAYIERADNRHEDLARKVTEIHHEVHFNNGSSVKDAAVRTESRVKRIERALGIDPDDAFEFTDQPRKRPEQE